MSKKANFSHQHQLFNPENARPVCQIGAGSVGSYLAYLLAKVGVKDIEVWDYDVVESHNVPMSLYSPEDIGRSKVDVLKERIRELTGVEIIGRHERFTGKELFRNVSVIACVDSMKTRELIWKNVRGNLSVDIFCDTRTSEMYAEAYAINGNDVTDIKRYDHLLFPDKEAVRQVCGRHGIAFATMRTASTVVANLTSFWQTGKKEWCWRERCDTLGRVD
ncbi:MAG: ThiF family adenylyltransferase [Patescibacteria group bacterium]